MTMMKIIYGWWCCLNRFHIRSPEARNETWWSLVSPEISSRVKSQGILGQMAHPSSMWHFTGLSTWKTVKWPWSRLKRLVFLKRNSSHPSKMRREKEEKKKKSGPLDPQNEKRWKCKMTLRRFVISPGVLLSLLSVRPASNRPTLPAKWS